ncbi:prepilin peptidase [Spongiibacter marinus]|uniref:prepilin peptidase n=1 Tax=Spongiibacter marinus TaxID=354246 RepID=UPI00041B4E02|nr:A24 family peptidase [Spongiibacter marinus]
MAIVIILLLAILAYVDWSSRRIPNALNLALFIASLSIFIGSSGISAYQWVVNIVLALTITLPGYLSNNMGAGDVKLLMALSPLWPPTTLLFVFASGTLMLSFIMILIEKSKRHDNHRARGLPIGTAVSLGAAMLPLTPRFPFSL